MSRAREGAGGRGRGRRGPGTTRETRAEENMVKGGPGTLRHTVYRFGVVMNHSKPQNRCTLCDCITTSLCSHSPSRAHLSTESIMQKHVCNYNIYMKEGRASEGAEIVSGESRYKTVRPCVCGETRMSATIPVTALGKRVAGDAAEAAGLKVAKQPRLSRESPGPGRDTLTTTFVSETRLPTRLW